MKIDIDPCDEDGSKLSLDVTEKEHGIDYKIAGIRAGESENIPSKLFAALGYQLHILQLHGNSIASPYSQIGRLILQYPVYQ